MVLPATDFRLHTFTVAPDPPYIVQD